jgi:hypothetical protein
MTLRLSSSLRVTWSCALPICSKISVSLAQAVWQGALSAKSRKVATFLTIFCHRGMGHVDHCDADIR